MNMVVHEPTIKKTTNPKQEYHRILLEGLSNYKDLYDVVEVRSVAKPKIGQSADSCYKYGKDETFRAISANYLIYLVLKKMGAWESYIETIARNSPKINNAGFDIVNDSIAESMLKAVVPHVSTPIAILGAVALKFASNWASLPLENLTQSLIGEANESLKRVIGEINKHINNFQKDLHVDSMLFAWGKYVDPGTREIGTWSKIREMVLNGPIKNDIRLVSLGCWVKKVSADIKIKYLNTLSDNYRARIYRDAIRENEWKKMVVLCYSLQFLGKKIDRDLYIRGVCDIDVFKSRLYEFTSSNRVSPHDILVYYDDTIFMGKECFVLTSDKFYYHNGDVLKSVDLETNGTAIYPILDEISKKSHFSGIIKNLIKLLNAIANEFS
ncbi:hypothetical protein SAMN05720781_3087 [Fibrobacter sp. UWT3]|uniref:hypothetical protein n=1 Tax=Fibrobacter sp. UWT3 TaxID=1896225 RepID=UPI000BCC8409|nr:hypothetical protein [Fibrobacter sp. UWT3]SOE79509.1 hypothetical protein SAMN05720781_3087 [Fibrobacter sp. UWT3]